MLPQLPREPRALGVEEDTDPAAPLGNVAGTTLATDLCSDRIGDS